MSHFAVLVIGEDVEKQLAPFHEFECDGVDDEFVQDVDETEKIKKEFEGRTKTLVKMPDGTMLDPYCDDFYRDPTEEESKEIGFGWSGRTSTGISYWSKDWKDGKWHRTKVHHIPEWCEKVEIPDNDFRSFVEDYHGKKCVPFGQKPDLSEEHKYGYALIDENGEISKIIDRTNPNSKWDWYIVGGRFQGHLKLKEGATGENGELSLVGIASGQKMAEEGYADVAKKGDVDVAGMREAAETKARLKWEKAIEAAVKASGKSTWETWESVRSRIEDIDEARKAYHAQPEVEAIKKAFPYEWFLKIDEFLIPGNEYVKRAGDGALVTFAVVKDGKWYQRGEMGWWACVSNEKDSDEWNSEFAKLVESLPDDTLLTVVDCHI